MGDLVLDAVQDPTTWEINRLASEAAHAVFWVHGLGSNCDRGNVTAYCDGLRMLVDFVGASDENDARQVNARLPEGLVRGRTVQMFVRYAGVESNALAVTLV